jgi:hypothetical protein
VDEDAINRAPPTAPPQPRPKTRPGSPTDRCPGLQRLRHGRADPGAEILPGVIGTVMAASEAT